MSQIDPSNIATKYDFAESLGFSRSYGPQLVKDDRVVMAPDGVHVLVAESVAKMQATADPSKRGVAKRHAAARAAKAAAQEQSPPTGPEESPEDAGPAQYSYQSAKAKREHWAAEREHAAWRKEAGELVERGEVVAAFANAGATLRGQLESWAAVLPPQLLGRDEAAMRATIADQVERVLHDLVQSFQKSAGDGA